MSSQGKESLTTDIFEFKENLKRTASQSHLSKSSRKRIQQASDQDTLKIESTQEALPFSDVRLLETDLTNILRHTPYPLFIFDKSLRLRKYSASSMKFLDISADQNILTNLSQKLVLPKISEMLDKTVKNATVWEQEVQDSSSCWWYLRIRPYLTEDQKTEGVILTLRDIDSFKQNFEHLKEANRFIEAILTTSRKPMLILDENSRVKTANRAFYVAFNTTKEQTQDRSIYELEEGRWNTPRMRKILEEILPKEKNIEELEFEYRLPQIGLRTLRINARLLQCKTPQTFILLSIDDITSRKKAEQALKQSEEQLRLMVESLTTHAIFMLDPSGRVISWNKSGESMFGYQNQEVLGHHFASFFTEKEKNCGKPKHLLQEAIKNGRIEEECMMIKKGPENFFATFVIKALLDEKESLRGFTCVIRDITEHKKILVARNLFFAVSSDLLGMMDFEGNLFHFNTAWNAILGFDMEELKKVSVFEKIHPEDRESTLAKINQLKNGAETSQFENRMQCKDGSYRWIAWNSSSLTEQNIIYIVGRDRTAEKQEHDALLESEMKFRAVADTANDAIITMNGRGNVIYFNPQAEKMFGYYATEIHGMSFSTLIPNQFKKPAQNKRFQSGTQNPHLIGNTVEIIAKRKDGTGFPIELSMASWNSLSDTFFTAIIRDISLRNDLEKHALEINEREHQRIGQDLHDNLGQQLTGILYMQKALTAKLSKLSLPEIAEAKEIEKLLDKSIQQTKSLMRGLHPVDLYSDGLMCALRELVENNKSLFTTSCIFRCPKPVLIYEHAVARVLYRIAQEALYNGYKHAKATRFLLSLTSDKESICLKVKCDGIGFNQLVKKKRGMRIFLMNHRAKMISASLDIGEDKDGGTLVLCSVPFSKLDLNSKKAIKESNSTKN
jgi:two-component system sensor kinase FixL